MQGQEKTSSEANSSRTQDQTTPLSHSRYQALVERIPAVVYIAECAPQGRWSYVSPRIQSLLGFSPAEWVENSANWTNRLHPEDREKTIAARLASAESEGGFVSEYRMLTRDEKVIWVRDEATIFPGAPDRPCIMEGVLLDITESKLAQSALRRIEERLSATLNNTPVILYALDTNGIFTLSEGRALQALHLKPGELVGQSVFDVYRDYPDIHAQVHRALSGEAFTCRSELPDLQLTYEVAWTPQKDSSGCVIGVTGVATDVSNRKRLEDARRESEERYRTVAETATDGLVTIDQDSRILFANTSMKRLFGYSASELIGQPLTMLIPESLRAKHKEAVQRYLKTGVRHVAWEGIEFTGQHKSGRNIAVEVSFGESLDQGRRTFTGIIRDITQRKQAEEALRQSEEKFARIVQSTPDAITLSSLPDRRFIEVNDSFTSMTGHSREEALGKNAKELGLVLTPNWLEGLVNGTEPGGILRDLEFTFRTGAGETRTGIITAMRMELSRGTCLLTIVRDITESKRAEEKLRKNEQQIQAMQKMDAVGRLAGGIAHDFNNLLMIISGQLHLLRTRLQHEHQGLEAIQHAERAADHAAALTRQLLAFGRMQTLQPQVLCLNVVLSDMQKLITPWIGPNIQLALNLDAELGSVKADPGQVEQVILNLVVNARDAMPKGGRLTISTTNVELDASFALLHPPVSPGSHVVLEVSDTGTGMDPETQARIFEPFFTTKEKGRGTGLGLASVYGVVKQSGGYISVDSVPEAGTAFRIYLPRVAERYRPVEPVPISERLPTGSETVLLTEDEPGVRDVTRQFLERYGYTVLEAGNAIEAIEVVKHHPDRIALLLTDLVMPGSGGKELAVGVVALRPEIKVIYMSGDAEYNVSEGTGVRGKLLPKPFTLESLLRLVRQTIDAKS